MVNAPSAPDHGRGDKGKGLSIFRCALSAAGSIARQKNALTVPAIHGDEAVTIGLPRQAITCLRAARRKGLVQFRSLQPRFSSESNKSAVIHGSLRPFACSAFFMLLRYAALMVEHLPCQSVTHFPSKASGVTQVPPTKYVTESAEMLTPAQFNGGGGKVWRFPQDLANRLFDF
jgi:hypothetical protein